MTLNKLKTFKTNSKTLRKIIMITLLDKFNFNRGLEKLFSKLKVDLKRIKR